MLSIAKHLLSPRLEDSSRSFRMTKYPLNLWCTMSKTIVSNRKAYHEYHVLETYTAGLVLTGTEIKSLRAGKVSMVDAHARIEKGEIFLYSLNISPYESGTHYNHAPTRIRKLLLQKREIAKLSEKIQEKGLTLIPLKLYFSRCWVKVELGVCRGKKLHDKRDSSRIQQVNRDMDRAKKSFNS
jgi:SsrA-binding protein